MADAKFQAAVEATLRAARAKLEAAGVETRLQPHHDVDSGAAWVDLTFQVDLPTGPLAGLLRADLGMRDLQLSLLYPFQFAAERLPAVAEGLLRANEPRRLGFFSCDPDERLLSFRASLLALDQPPSQLQLDGLLGGALTVAEHYFLFLQDVALGGRAPDSAMAEAASTPIGFIPGGLGAAFTQYAGEPLE